MGVPIHMAPSVLLQLRPSDLGDLIALELVIDKPIINQSVNESMNQSNNQSINLYLYHYPYLNQFYFYLYLYLSRGRPKKIEQ